VRFESAFKSVNCPRDEQPLAVFHTAGPATEKALSPNFVLVRAQSGADSVPDHCCCRGVQVCVGTDARELWTSPVPAWTSKEREGKGKERERGENDVKHPMSQIPGYATGHLAGRDA